MIDYGPALCGRLIVITTALMDFGLMWSTQGTEQGHFTDHYRRIVLGLKFNVPLSVYIAR